jgi:AcrR family transcriptional regulator
LLRAAERLFAAHGVDSVSLRQIAASAGQKNHSAVLYHFGDKRELINALLDRHSGPLQAAWLTMLDHVDAEGRDSLEELVGMFVRPLVQKLDDPDGGVEYLLIVAQLVHSATFPIIDFPAVNAPGIVALIRRLANHAGPMPPSIFPLRMMRVATLLYGSIALYHRSVSNGAAIDRDEFVSDLVASLVALIAHPAQLRQDRTVPTHPQTVA